MIETCKCIFKVALVLTATATRELENIVSIQNSIIQLLFTCTFDES